MSDITFKIEFITESEWLKERTKELGWQEFITTYDPSQGIIEVENSIPWTDYLSDYAKGILISELTKAQRQQAELQAKQTVLSQMEQVENILGDAITISINS